MLPIVRHGSCASVRVKRFGMAFTVATALLAAGCTSGDDEEMAGGPFSSASGGAAASGAQQAASAPAGTEEQVVVEDHAFHPEELTVAEGTTVTWVNEDDLGHTVTHGEGGAPVQDAAFDEPISVDQVVSYTFEEPGTYPVTCSIHPAMQMTVIVEEG